MSFFSFLPFGKRQEAPAQEKAGRGALTGCDLGDVGSLTRPFARGPFYRLRPPFSPDAARLSLELANTAYTLSLDAWREAGWTDFSVLIDDSLQSGMDGDGVRSRFKLLRARAALKELNPLAQIAGALRQRERSDTVKAVVMTRPDGEGRWLVAIGFMGTGSRLYDWISNFRFTPEDGFHRGFYQLCESFEMNAEDIVFPTAAEALGLEKLTLGQVFADMRSLSSPFRLWMAGHSQGGAVLQVLCHRLMTGWGALAQNMVGYGFASPTVATGRFVYDPAAYPLYHILNGDDVVPRVGALLHLGLCLEYAPDEDFRQALYQRGSQGRAAGLCESLSFWYDGMQDMPSALAHMSALLEVLAEEKGAEGMNELLTSWWAVGAVDKVLWRAGDRALEALDRLLGSAADAYRALTGRDMDAPGQTALRQRLRPIVQGASMRELLDAFSALAVPPHRLADAYAAIVLRGLDALRPFIWIKASAGLPVRRYAQRLGQDWPQPEPPAFARRRAWAKPAPRGKLRLSYTARRRA